MLALQNALKKKGITLIEGDYLTGKTYLIPSIIKGMLSVSHNERQIKEKLKEESKIKRYSIAELMKEDSSDDENYKDGTQNQVHFPWFKGSYKHIYDELDINPEQSSTTIHYKTSEMTDKKVTLKPKQ